MPKRIKRVLIFLWAAALCLAAYAVWVSFVDCGYAEASFLDVGQGDSCLLRTSRGSAVLIDGGDEGAGEDVILPFLRANSVRKLNAVFVSHMHDDHISGILELMEAGFPIDKIYYSDRAGADENYEKLIELVRKNRIPTEKLSTGDTIELENLRFTVLTSGDLNSEIGDENSNSLIIRAEYGENSILLTGDATGEEMDAVLKAGVKSDILKVSHHGALNSNTYELASAAESKLAVISVGEGNKFGHPSRKTLEVMGGAGIPVVRTDYDGTITVIMNRSRVKNVRCSRERRSQ